jgi:glycosyltransferase involved in cell wall biosynthesis
MEENSGTSIHSGRSGRDRETIENPKPLIHTHPEKKNVHFVRREYLLKAADWFIKRTESVLDIGCGIRPQKYFSPKKHYCVDAHQQYLDVLKQRQSNGRTDFIYVHSLWGEALTHPLIDAVDSIFVLDVIEHVDKEEGKLLLQQTIEKAKEQVIIFTPLGFIEQHHDNEKDAWGLDGGKWQEHLSGWEPEDFGDGWEFIVCEDFHTHDNMNHRYERPKGAFFAIYTKRKAVPPDHPQFSIIIPTYNQASYLPEALNSLRDQTFSDFEVIVVNDGSTDETKEVIQPFLNSDGRIRYVEKENGGVGSALNAGLQHARGEWICWLSSDDWYEIDKLEIHRRYIEQFPQIKFFYTHFYYYNQETAEKTEPELWQLIPSKEYQTVHFFIGNYVHGNSFAAHRSVFDSAGPFNQTFRQGQDYDMWLRISALFELKYIDRRTCVTRMHPGQDTSAFVNGMYYDSARAAVDFLNSHTYEELFPFLDLTDLKDIKLALEKTINTAYRLSAFMYWCGPIPALIDRLHEWIASRCPSGYRAEIRDAIRSIVQKEKALPEQLQSAFDRIGRPASFEYLQYDLFNEIRVWIEHLLSEGEREKAAELERYLQLLFTKRETQQINFVQRQKVFSPAVYGYPVDSIFTPLPYDKLLRWDIEPVTHEGVFSHDITAECPDCETPIRVKMNLLAGEEGKNIRAVCHRCRCGIAMNEADIHRYIERIPAASQIHRSKREKPVVAFIARGLHGKSGGTKVFTRYIQWVHDLGADVHTFSTTEQGDWFRNPGTFTQVEDLHDIEFPDVDFVFVYCILDIPKIVSKIPLSKIVYLSQAYEGFLYGNSIRSARTDKALFHSLHSLPIKIAVVSKHLKQFIDAAFGKNSLLIPNFINRSVFAPAERKHSRPSTILFVGNPFHPLKGLDFLLTTLSTIQQSAAPIPNLHLTVAAGIATKEMKAKLREIARNCEFAISMVNGLTDSEMAALVRSSALYVCTSWYEGFSLSVLEAMSCGTPVITTRNMGAESFCIDGVNGFVVTYGDVPALASRITDVLGERLNASNLIRNGFETAEEYSEEKSHGRFTDTFSRIFDERVLSEVQSEDGTRKTQNPVFSILVPTYNHASFLPDALTSIRCQTVKQWEAIVVDDGSTDETEQIAKNFALCDERIRYFRKSNGGVASALNTALDHARGQWICWLSSDDLFEKDKLKVHESYIERFPEKKFFYTDYFGIDEKNGIKNPSHIDQRHLPAPNDAVLSFFYTNYINGITICIHRSAFSAAGRFNESLRSGQDFDMWLRMSLFHQPQYIPERTASYRIHGQQGIQQFPEAGV